VTPGRPRRAALFFDLDGTLIDTDALHMETFAALFAARGRVIDAAFYRDRIQGRQNAAIFTEHFPGEDCAALAATKEAAVRAKLAGGAAPAPGAAALIARARRTGWGLAVVTNAPAANAAAFLAAIGLSDAFDTIVLGDECARGKPAPDPYATAMDRLGVSPDRALAFEDSAAGITSATAAGAMTLGLTTTLTAAALAAAGAAAAIADFTDPALTPYLDHLSGEAA